MIYATARIINMLLRQQSRTTARLEATLKITQSAGITTTGTLFDTNVVTLAFTCIS